VTIHAKTQAWTSNLLFPIAVAPIICLTYDTWPQAVATSKRGKSCTSLLMIMTSRSTLWCGSLRASDQCLRGKNDSSYRFVFIPTAFIDDESEAVHVELPMVTADNDGMLASQILKTGCHNIKSSIYILVICLNRNTMARWRPWIQRAYEPVPPNSQVKWVPCVSPHEQKSCRTNLYGQSITCTVPHAHALMPLVSVKIKIVLHQEKRTKITVKAQSTPTLWVPSSLIMWQKWWFSTKYTLA
jgi:hypothetical protein